ncbi:MAG: glycoside hydrolase family 28 protein [Phycisphaerae bacterium]
MADPTRLNILDFGAVADDSTINTSAIQQAIDTATAAGGGTVVVPPGSFRTGTLTLASNLTLEIQTGAKLIGSENMEDYPPLPPRHNPFDHKDLQPYNLIRALDATNVTICGGGQICGSGPAFWDPPSKCEFYTEKDRRPCPMIDLTDSADIRIRDVAIVDSPGWTVHICRCRNVRIQGIDIRNSLIGPNTDGLDITDSSDVFISDCNVVCGDDAIVLKSLGGTNERICVTNCTLQTRCSALKLGANESLGTIRQIAMSNCVVRDSSRGVSLYCMTGGTFEDVVIDNLVLECDNDLKLVCPIHINVSRNPDPVRDSGVGAIRNVRIANVLCTSDARILLTAEAPGMLENIHLSEIHMTYHRIEDEFELARKAVGLQFSPFNPDARAAKACIAAENIRGLSLRNISTTWPENTEVPMHLLWARNVQGGLVDCPLGGPSRSGVERFDVENSQLTIRD